MFRPTWKHLFRQADNNNYNNWLMKIKCVPKLVIIKWRLWNIEACSRLLVSGGGGGVSVRGMQHMWEEGWWRIKKSFIICTYSSHQLPATCTETKCLEQVRTKVKMKTADQGTMPDFLNVSCYHFHYQELITNRLAWVIFRLLRVQGLLSIWQGLLSLDNEIVCNNCKYFK